MPAGLRRVVAGLAMAASLVTAAPAQPAADILREQVLAAERAFARSMAERDFDAFGRHVNEHAVFFGAGGPLRGKAAVLAGWRRFFDGPQAPFSWQPDQVEVLADGQLAHSSGPVRDATGKLIARFHSVWRQDAPGVWRVVFDRGETLRE